MTNHTPTQEAAHAVAEALIKLAECLRAEASEALDNGDRETAKIGINLSNVASIEAFTWQQYAKSHETTLERFNHE